MFEATWFRLAALAAPIVGLAVAASRSAWIAAACMVALELVVLAVALRTSSTRRTTEATLPGTVVQPQAPERCLIAVGTETTIAPAVHEALNHLHGYRPARICMVVPPDETLSAGAEADGHADGSSARLDELTSEVERLDARAFLESGAIDPVACVRHLIEQTGAEEVILATGAPLAGPALAVYEAIGESGVRVTHVGVGAS